MDQTKPNPPTTAQRVDWELGFGEAIFEASLAYAEKRLPRWRFK